MSSWLCLLSFHFPFVKPLGFQTLRRRVPWWAERKWHGESKFLSSPHCSHLPFSTSVSLSNTPTCLSLKHPYTSLSQTPLHVSLSNTPTHTPLHIVRPHTPTHTYRGMKTGTLYISFFVSHGCLFLLVLAPPNHNIFFCNSWLLFSSCVTPPPPPPPPPSHHIIQH